MTDVAAVLHAAELDFGDGRVRRPLRLLHRIAERRDAQHASAGDHDLAPIERRAGMEDLAVRMRVGGHPVKAFDDVARRGLSG